ncbi:Thiol-disulfide isomerase or thioredoxin [Mucilaginibacter gossypiicola]|uniref:Thiol-disulfide isomerase or thioredoxin n=1 Tax=Mucilaginibacter gossypiicola TaxID=551995 RepID=A0A1H8STN5_9SPHI|nr:TlpA disulfide reductase family protein [Mucilaginibacter gossypiicola]SEO81543.1 Thiol-disulfide isomerase or thioredoxin [Mucilaginibacter gossypiicola]
MKVITYSLFAFLILIGFTVNGQTKKIKSIPDIDVYDINGKHTTLKKLGQNKVLFIDCWFVPCPPCFREMGMLHKLYAKYKDNPNFNFITLCQTDSGIVKRFIAQDKSIDNFVRMYKDFSKRQDFKLPVYFIPGCNEKIYTGKTLAKYTPDDKTKCPDRQFGFRGYPTVIIFNKKGKLIFKKTGYGDHEDENNLKMENLIVQNIAAK